MSRRARSLFRKPADVVTDLAGGPYSSRAGNLVATNGHIHDAMVEIIQGFFDTQQVGLDALKPLSFTF